MLSYVKNIFGWNGEDNANRDPVPKNFDWKREQTKQKYQEKNEKIFLISKMMDRREENEWRDMVMKEIQSAISRGEQYVEVHLREEWARELRENGYELDPLSECSCVIWGSWYTLWMADKISCLKILKAKETMSSYGPMRIKHDRGRIDERADSKDKTFDPDAFPANAMRLHRDLTQSTRLTQLTQLTPLTQLTQSTQLTQLMQFL